MFYSALFTWRHEKCNKTQSNLHNLLSLTNIKYKIYLSPVQNCQLQIYIFLTNDSSLSLKLLVISTSTLYHLSCIHSYIQILAWSLAFLSRSSGWYPWYWYHISQARTMKNNYKQLIILVSVKHEHESK